MTQSATSKLESHRSFFGHSNSPLPLPLIPTKVPVFFYPWQNLIDMFFKLYWKKCVCGVCLIIICFILQHDFFFYLFTIGLRDLSPKWDLRRRKINPKIRKIQISRLHNKLDEILLVGGWNIHVNVQSLYSFILIPRCSW